MTNPDRDELVKLEAERAELVAKNEAATSWGAAVGARYERIIEIDRRLAALRRLASSDGGVKVRELEWHQHPDGESQRYEGIAAIGSNYAVFKAWWGLHDKWGWVGDSGFHTEEEAKAACQTDYEARIKSALVEVPAVKSEPELVAWPANLNPRTLDLVQRFALALAKKLRLAEEKYGHTDGWLRDDWEAECRDHLYQHLEKGDPRDVAAYCAFMWHHGWITYRPEPVASKRPVAFRVRQHRLSNHYELYTDEKDAQFWADDRGVDYEGLYLVADRYLAPPADAGMREAFVRALASLAAAISILERTPKAKKAVASDKMFDAMLDDYRKALEAGRAALTAPGATTKSDRGVTLEMETRRADDNGRSCKHFCDALRLIASGAPDAVAIASAAIKMPWLLDEVGPSDPSPTRSEVTVEELAEAVCKACGDYWWQSTGHSPNNKRWIERATKLLETHEIRRK